MTRLTRRAATIAIAIGLGCLFSIGAAQAQQKHQWKFVTIIPAGQTVFVDRFKELAAEITKRTNGEVEVSLYTAGELPYKATEHLRVTAKGLVDMSEVVGSMAFGEVPTLLLGDLPYLALTKAEQKTLRDIMWPEIYSALRKKGVEPIAWAAYPPRNMVLRAPVKGLSQLEGLKIRTSGGLEAEYLKLWGASPAFVAWAELYPAVQRGIVDGLLTAAVAIEAAKLYEVAPHFLKIDGPVAHIYIAVNQESWNKLSTEQQKTVKAVGDWWTDRWQKLVVDEADNGAIKRMQDAGQIKSLVIVPADSRAETRKKMIPVYRSAVKEKVGAEGSAALERALTALKLQ
jgi:TRAP-type C4-dicarboxylate transport system substrate-binding protein